MPNSLDIFLSHANADRIVARKLADELKKYSFDAFVAHDDIKLGDNWESALFERIKNCDLFIALLSENFHKAQYTDNEVGIAMGLGKSILPISIDDTMPYGFLSKYQAKKMSPEIDGNQVSRIFKEFMSKTKTSSVDHDLMSSLIYAETFVDANRAIKQLSEHTEFSDDDINAIAEGFIGNDQIRGCFAVDWCVRILKKNWKRIDKKLQEQLKDVTYTSAFHE